MNANSFETNHPALNAALKEKDLDACLLKEVQSITSSEIIPGEVDTPQKRQLGKVLKQQADELMLVSGIDRITYLLTEKQKPVLSGLLKGIIAVEGESAVNESIHLNNLLLNIDNK